jgi:hypothetical protein
VKLNQSVKRHRNRFSRRFYVSNDKDEFSVYIPNCYIKKGVVKENALFVYRARHAMLSSVLNSERAIQVNVAIMRAF